MEFALLLFSLSKCPNGGQNNPSATLKADWAQHAAVMEQEGSWKCKTIQLTGTIMFIITTVSLWYIVRTVCKVASVLLLVVRTQRHQCVLNLEDRDRHQRGYVVVDNATLAVSGTPGR